MKKLSVLILFILSVPACAANMPDNVYFRAMRDEMARTKNELRVKGAPKPFFAAYKLTRKTEGSVSASFGAAYRHGSPRTSLSVQAYVYAGDAKNNSSGFDSDLFYYRPSRVENVPQSYEGIRRALWEASDFAFLTASDRYEKKVAYKRRKTILDDGPEFSRAPRAGYAEPIEEFDADAQRYLPLAEKMSALGKDVPYLEQFFVLFSRTQRVVYFLDSENDFYQYAIASVSIRLEAHLRNRDGYKENFWEVLSFPADQIPDEAKLMEKSRKFLAQAKQYYAAKRAQPYVGPVLLQPGASGGFFNQLFVRNARYAKPLLSAQDVTDASAGSFKDKTGMRVISRMFDVYDRPALHRYGEKLLTGFTPVDDEGVAAQELQLVKKGVLTALPAARNALKFQGRSNGRARLGDNTLPRANLTNVFFEPASPLPAGEMEEKLLDRCRELELEYCYIFSSFPSLNNGQGEMPFAERIYTKDGHKEPAYGLRLEGVTPRSLRDVIAAGDDAEAFSVQDGGGVNLSVVAPSVIVDEMEVMPSQRQPNRKPFVPLP